MERIAERTEAATPCGASWLYGCPMRRALSRAGLAYAPVARKVAYSDAVRIRYDAAYNCGTECTQEACLRRTGGMVGSPRALAYDAEHVH
jgi:hypothetical protein